MQILQDKLTSYKYIIWDWNGTLLDDCKLSQKIVNKQLKDHGLSEISYEELRQKFSFPIKDFLFDSWV